MSRSAVLRALLAALCFCAIAASCGLPVSEVEAIAAEDHQELLNGTTTTTEPVPEPQDPETTTLTLYFIGPDSKLERVERDFTLPVVDDVLNALEAGPSPEEQALFEERGLLESRIPEGLSARSGGRNTDLGIQRVDVDPAGDLRVRLEAEPAVARLTVKQIVCTILELPVDEISGVEIFDGEEEALQLSDNDAEPITGPATIEDFDGCKTGTDELLEIEERLEEESSEEDPDADANG